MKQHYICPNAARCLCGTSDVPPTRVWNLNKWFSNDYTNPKRSCMHAGPHNLSEIDHSCHARKWDCGWTGEDVQCVKVK
jgi:hypothetical protein